MMQMRFPANDSLSHIHTQRVESERSEERVKEREKLMALADRLSEAALSNDLLVRDLRRLQRVKGKLEGELALRREEIQDLDGKFQV